MRALLVFKISAALVLLVVAIAGGLLPLALAMRRANKEMVRGCNAFAGGVLLAAAIVHMLPDAGRSLESVGLSLKRALVPGSDEAFPVASAVAGFAFLLLMYLEASIKRGLRREVRDHSMPSPDGHGGWKAPLLPSVSSEQQGEEQHPLSMPVSPIALRASLQSTAVAVVGAEPQCVSAKALVAALVAHSLLEGIGIGAQRSMTTTVTIFVAVGAHKGLAAFALGTSLLEKCERHDVWRGVVLFGACSPIGILVGAAAASHMHSAGSGLLIAMASGTFLYVSVPELLTPAFEGSGYRRAMVASAMLGFMGMSFLAFWA